MFISGNIVFKKSDVSDITDLENLLSVPNPEYHSWLQRGSRYTEKPAEKLLFIDELPDGNFSCPRNVKSTYFKKSSRAAMKDLRTQGEPIPKIEFTGSLKDYQDEYLEEDVLLGNDVVNEVPCGHGKTVMALYRTVKLKRATLVMVETKFLAQQWLNRIETFTKGARVQMLSPKNTIYTNIDIGIITFDLLASRKFPPGFYAHWGHVIMDEAHIVAASTYHPEIQRFPALYRTALTATFRRGDGLERILQFHFGGRFTMDNRFPLASYMAIETGVDLKYGMPFSSASLKKAASKPMKPFVEEFIEQCKAQGHILSNLGDSYMLRPKQRMTHSDVRTKQAMRYLYGKVEKSYENVSVSMIDTYASLHPKRFKQTVALTTHLCQNEGRKILILSKRKEVLHSLESSLQKRGLRTHVLVSGSDYNVSTDTQVVLGIAQIAKQGLDIDFLDTLILLHPFKDVEQPIGRIRRSDDPRKRGLVLFMYDNIEPYKYLFKSSLRYISNSATLVPSNSVSKFINTPLDELLKRPSTRNPHRRSAA